MMRVVATLGLVAAVGVAASAIAQQAVPKGPATGTPPLGNATGVPPLGNQPPGIQGNAKGGGGIAGFGGGQNIPAVGPRCDEARMALSTDGLTFRPDGAVAVPMASVPDGAFFQNQLVFYYVGGGDRHGIFRATTHDGVWERGDEVQIGGVFNQNAVDPDVVVLPDGRIRLYYFEGNFRGPQAGAGGAVAGVPATGNSPFFAAVSTDGIHFTAEGKVFETAGGTDPSVVRLADGSWLLAVARAMTQDIVIARATDGLQFTQVAVLANGGIPELMTLDGGRVRLFFNGQGGMVSRVSADGGRTWSDEQGTRLMYQGFAADPSVVAMADGTYRMFFKTQDQVCQVATAIARGLVQGGGQGGPQPQGGAQGVPKGALKGPVTP